MLYVNSVKIYQFKAKDSGIKLYLLLYSFCWLQYDWRSWYCGYSQIFNEKKIENKVQIYLKSFHSVNKL